MSLSSTRTAVVKVLCIAVAAGIAFGLASSRCYAQEQQRWQLMVTPPENARAVWSLQARHVASELELDREASRKLMQTYVSARQEHLDKVKALPQTRESFRQFWEITWEAKAALEKSLVEAIGEEKGKKAAEAIGGFSFLSDHMTADVLAAQRKALAAVLDYQTAVNKILKEAREAGSFEGTREKFTALFTELGEKASAIYSEQQLDEWRQKYGWLLETPSSR